MNIETIRHIDVVADGNELLKKLELVRANKDLPVILDRYKKSREFCALMSDNINSRVFVVDGKLMAVGYCDHENKNYPDNSEPVKPSDLCISIADLVEVGIPLCMNDEYISGDYDFSWRMPYSCLLLHI